MTCLKKRRVTRLCPRLPQGPEKALAQLCLNPNRFSCFLQALHGFVVQILAPAHLHCNTAPERTRGLSQQEAELQILPQKKPTDSSPMWLQYSHPPSSRSSKLQCLLPWKQVPGLLPPIRIFLDSQQGCILTLSGGFFYSFFPIRLSTAFQTPTSHFRKSFSNSHWACQ